MPPIFILSSERSGTNLLRSILGAHSNLAAPPPPHLLTFFSRVLPYYSNLDHLAKDIHSLLTLEGSPFSWKDCPTEKEVLNHTHQRNLAGIIFAFYDLYAKKMGKKTWVCKEALLFDHAYRILYNRPDAKFIYLVRDGRDVANSEKKIPPRNRHCFLIAEKWKQEQIKCLELLQDLQDKSNVFFLKYEELISKGEEKVEELCNWLEIEKEKGMLDFHQQSNTSKEADSSVYWKNLKQPILAGNQQKFKQELSNRNIRIFERTAAPQLLQLGYPLEDPGNLEKPINFKKEIYYRSLNKIHGFLYQRNKKVPQDIQKFIKHRNTILVKRKKEAIEAKLKID